MHAVSFVLLCGIAAAFAEIPGEVAREVRDFGVAEVRGGLVADTDGPESDFERVDEDAQKRHEGAENEHHALDEQDEYTEDGYDDVELGCARGVLAGGALGVVGC